LGLVVGIALWWLFRPERLFINQQVSEAAPDGVASLQPAFTGSLRAAAGASEISGRVNVVKTGGKLHLEIATFESKATQSFIVALAPNADSRVGALTLGAVTVVGHEGLMLPAGVDLAINKTVLLISANQIVATAALEPF
jgi:hypothetical protein